MLFGKSYIWERVDGEVGKWPRRLRGKMRKVKTILTRVQNIVT
jgi:hypothetical protein